jgi:hypothetical protein
MTGRILRLECFGGSPFARLVVVVVVMGREGG